MSGVTTGGDLSESSLGARSFCAVPSDYKLVNYRIYALNDDWVIRIYVVPCFCTYTVVCQGKVLGIIIFLDVSFSFLPVLLLHYGVSGYNEPCILNQVISAQ